MLTGNRIWHQAQLASFVPVPLEVRIIDGINALDVVRDIVSAPRRRASRSPCTSVIEDADDGAPPSGSSPRSPRGRACGPAGTQAHAPPLRFSFRGSQPDGSSPVVEVMRGQQRIMGAARASYSGQQQPWPRQWEQSPTIARYLVSGSTPHVVVRGVRATRRGPGFRGSHS